MEGVLGLGPYDLSNAPNFIKALYDANLIANTIASLYISYHNTSILELGDYDNTYL